MEKFHRWHFPHLALEFINHLNIVHSTIKFTREISSTEISFLDLIIYTKGSRLYTRLHTKPTDRHMYLNFCSEHHMSLKSSKPYSQFLRLKRVHTEPQFFIGGTNAYVFFSSFGGNNPMIQSWEPGRKQIKLQGSNCSPQQKPIRTQKYYLCSSLHIVEPIQTLRNFFQTLVLFRQILCQ